MAFDYTPVTEHWNPLDVTCEQARATLETCRNQTRYCEFEQHIVDSVCAVETTTPVVPVAAEPRCVGGSILIPVSNGVEIDAPAIDDLTSYSQLFELVNAADLNWIIQLLAGGCFSTPNMRVITLLMLRRVYGTTHSSFKLQIVANRIHTAWDRHR